METIMMKPQTMPSIPPPSLPPSISMMAGLSGADSRYKICEYLLIFGPDKQLDEEIRLKKRMFFEKYQNPAAIYGKPHITLANFIQSDMADKVIISRLKIIAKNSNKIRIKLKNYGWFSSSATLYIDVLYKTDIEQLVRKISAGIKRFALADKKFPPHFITTPLLTICKGLSEEQYERSRIEYEKECFSAEFTADAMVLLKRCVDNNKYQELARFEFGGPEILTTIKQGDMFNPPNF